MKVLELFSGTGHISDEFRRRGHKAWKVDWSSDLDANLHTDISKLTAEDIKKLCKGRPNVIWASPDCATYSVAACYIHRNGVEPKTEYAAFCDECDRHVIDLIAELKPRYWFIENPRSLFRKVHSDTIANVLGGGRYTVTYCQYGAETMNPTDIWTNHPNPQFLPMCKNNAPCHNRAPRGSKTGTQGKDTWSRAHSKGASDGMYSKSIMRGIMPDKLIKHIVDICEEGAK